MMNRFLACVVVCWVTAACQARPAQVILLRHGEKPADDRALHLSTQGRERAQALVGFLTTNAVVSPAGPPEVLIATRATRHGHGQRPGETLEPTARALRLPVRCEWDADDYRELAARVLRDTAFDGKRVVICWVHSSLPQLAAALGVKPKPGPWKEDIYDRAWVIGWKQDRARLRILTPGLLPGDRQDAVTGSEKKEKNAKRSRNRRAGGSLR